ncbi:YhhN-like family protein [Brugia pahangi]
MNASLLALPYFALVFIFYHQSNGFIRSCDNLYEYWKTLPVLILSILYYAVGSSFSNRQHIYASLGLLAGAIGDYMITRPNDGLILGAACFAIGHIFYLLTFTYRIGNLCIPLLFMIILISFIILYVTFALLLIVHPIASTIMIIYSFLLSICVLFSGSLYICGGPYDQQRQFNNLLRFLGFLLFYLSDSALIIHHVGIAVPVAEKLILSTYFIAQYLILCGSSLSSSSSSSSLSLSSSSLSPSHCYRSYHLHQKADK